MESVSLWERVETGAKVGAWDWEPAWDRWMFSTGWRRLHGVDPDCQLDRQDLWALIHPDDTDAVRQILIDALTRLQPCNLEHRIIRRNDGAVRRMHVWGDFVYDEQSRILKMAGIVRDITEQTSLPTDATRGDQLQVVLDNTIDTIWAVDQDYRFIVSNRATQQAVKQIVGREFARGDSALALIPPGMSVEYWRTGYDRAFKGEHVTSEIAVGTPPRWVEHRINPLPDAMGEIRAVVVVGRNITDRKRLEASVQMYSAQLAAVLESSADIVWAVDANYGYIFGNRALQAEMVRAYGRELAPGDNVLDTPVPERVREQWRGFYDRALRGEAFTLEAPSEIRDRWYEYEYRPITDVDGRIVGVVAAGNDITRRRQAEAALRESEERYRLLADSLPVPMLVEDLDTHTIMYANDQACRRFEWALPELVGMDSARFYAEPGERERLLFSLTVHGRADSVVLQVRTQTGSIVWAQANACQLAHAGKPAIQVVFQ